MSQVVANRRSGLARTEDAAASPPMPLEVTPQPSIRLHPSGWFSPSVISRGASNGLTLSRDLYGDRRAALRAPRAGRHSSSQKHQPADRPLRHRTRAPSTAPASARSIKRPGHVYGRGSSTRAEGPTCPWAQAGRTNTITSSPAASIREPAAAERERRRQPGGRAATWMSALSGVGTPVGAHVQPKALRCATGGPRAQVRASSPRRSGG
jgi:hypothetical protein